MSYNYYCQSCEKLTYSDTQLGEGNVISRACQCGGALYEVCAYIRGIEHTRANDAKVLESINIRYRREHHLEREGFLREIMDAEQPLARALHFPYGDDITLPSTECATGDNTVVSLAQMAEGYITDLERENARLRNLLECYAVSIEDSYGRWYTCCVCGKSHCGSLRHADTCPVARPCPYPLR